MDDMNPIDPQMKSTSSFSTSPKGYCVSKSSTTGNSLLEEKICMLQQQLTDWDQVGRDASRRLHICINEIMSLPGADDLKERIVDQVLQIANLLSAKDATATTRGECVPARRNPIEIGTEAKPSTITFYQSPCTSGSRAQSKLRLPTTRENTHEMMELARDRKKVF